MIQGIGTAAILFGIFLVLIAAVMLILGEDILGTAFRSIIRGIEKCYSSLRHLSSSFVSLLSSGWHILIGGLTLLGLSLLTWFGSFKNCGLFWVSQSPRRLLRRNPHQGLSMAKTPGLHRTPPIKDRRRVQRLCKEILKTNSAR